MLTEVVHGGCGCAVINQYKEIDVVGLDVVPYVMEDFGFAAIRSTVDIVGADG
jgi:hypothetical protein